MSDAIVLTGATSGFGVVALKELAERTDRDIIVGARSPERVQGEFGTRVQAVPLDLERLSSVRDFCAAIEGVSIGTLGMNAGITSRSVTTTVDGFERVFQVNYLSHVLMYRLLQAQLTSDAVVLSTGSGTHDPDEGAPPPAPRHARAEWLAFPSRDPERDRFRPRAAGRAYTASKLCCILMAMEIARREPKKRVASFDPGFLPETNLAREFPAALAGLVKRIIPLTMPRDRTGSVATTAPAYAGLVLGERLPEQNGGYIAMRGGEAVEVQPSELARQTGLSASLWDESNALLDI
ncbi:MAG: SDR family NAD(P)-dependent oxidoreductase [Pseudomonadota bacterium]